MNDLKSLCTQDLLTSADRVVAQEKVAITLTTRHFQEIYRRRAYLPMYASMFEMLTLKWNYCAASASLRMNAVRLIEQIPAVQTKLESGELSMTAAASIQTFLNNEKKAERPYSLNAKIELVEACLNKSTREVQKEFVRRNPEIEKRDSVRATSDDRVRLEVSISQSSLEKLKQLKGWLSHSDLSLGQIIERLAEDGLEKYSPERKAQRAKMRADAKALAENVESNVGCKVEDAVHAHELKPNLAAQPRRLRRSRYITARERHNVNFDGGCSFVDEHSGRRCCSTSYLQLDHVQPFAEGGASTAENLRWMCGAHNRWRQTHAAPRHKRTSCKSKQMKGEVL